MINLSQAKIHHRRKVFNWLYFSDFADFLKGLKGFNINNSLSYEDFEEDYADYFFNGTDPEKGNAYIINNDNEEIGFISYTAYHLLPKMAELDIWMKSLAYTGKGYGTCALKRLCDDLSQKGFRTFIIRPSIENYRAIRSYEKAGFIREKLTPKKYYRHEYIDYLSDGEYGKGNDVFLVRNL